MTPTGPRPLRSTFSTPAYAPKKWYAAPPTPPSESTLRFVRAGLAEPPAEPFVQRDDDSNNNDERDFFLPVFDRAVGSPVRRSVQSQLSVPATPTAALATDARKKAPWTWPKCGEAAPRSAPLDNPFKSTVVAFDDLVGRTSTRAGPRTVLATRYVRVDGLSHRLDQEDLHGLFTVRLFSLLPRSTR